MMMDSSRPSTIGVMSANIAPTALPRRLWLATFAGGCVLWLAAAAAFLATENTILAPNLILVGTFLVPICTVLFLLARPRADAHLPVQAMLLGFLLGGTAGVVASGTIEVYLLPHVAASNTLIGTTEEGAKALIVVGVASMVQVRVPRDGMVLGAIVGAGFAAFESAGYALGELLEDSPRHPLVRVMETEVSRAIFAPFGHITWTAIMGGALFASAWATGRFRIDARVLWTFVGVVALHALWDAAYGFAIQLSNGLGGHGWSFGWPDTAVWAGTPTGGELVRFDLIYNTLLAALAAIGYVWAWRCWRGFELRRWSAAHAR
jgi:protease PrsW